MQVVALELIEFALAKELEKNPELASMLGDAFVKIHREFWEADYVRLITDRWGDALTFGDVFAFVQVHAMLASGKAVMTEVEVGEGPVGDRFKSTNNELLQRLPPPFLGEFWGGVADCDGVVQWSSPIEGNVILNDGQEVRRTIAAAQAPLEVGHTNGGTTLRHLGGSGCLARWPYGSPIVTIIHTLWLLDGGSPPSILDSLAVDDVSESDEVKGRRMESIRRDSS